MGREDFLKRLKFHNHTYKAEKGTYEKIENCLKRGISTALVGLTIASFAGCTSNDKGKTTVTEPSITTTQKDKYEDLDSPQKVLKDFKERYIQEYNAKNGTNISPNSIELLISPQTYIYRTYDDQLVTHGSLPEEVENIFQNHRINYEKIYSDYRIEVIQILCEENPIDSFTNFTSSNGESVKGTVVSGNLSEERIMEELRKR